MRLSPHQLDARDVNWVTQEIKFPFGTWIESQLFADEFYHKDEATIGNRLIEMFNALGAEIDKAFAGNRVDNTLKLKYWRKVSTKVRKMKPLELKATLFEHPDYNQPWMYVEYA